MYKIFANFLGRKNFQTNLIVWRTGYTHDIRSKYNFENLFKLTQIHKKVVNLLKPVWKNHRRILWNYSQLKIHRNFDISFIKYPLIFKRHICSFCYFLGGVLLNFLLWAYIILYYDISSSLISFLQFLTKVLVPH